MVSNHKYKPFNVGDIFFITNGKGITRQEIKDHPGELAAIQKTILDVCAVYVKPGGALIYSTCTIDRIVNEENVTAFLKAHEEYELESLSDYMPECLKKRAEKGYITLLQGVDHCDGFFISRLRRRK